MTPKPINQKRYEAIMRHLAHWGHFGSIPPNVRDILRRTYLKLSEVSKTEVEKEVLKLFGSAYLTIFK